MPICSFITLVAPPLILPLYLPYPPLTTSFSSSSRSLLYRNPFPFPLSFYFLPPLPFSLPLSWHPGTSTRSWPTYSLEQTARILTVSHCHRHCALRHTQHRLSSRSLHHSLFSPLFPCSGLLTPLSLLSPTLLFLSLACMTSWTRQVVCSATCISTPLPLYLQHLSSAINSLSPTKLLCLNCIYRRSYSCSSDPALQCDLLEGSAWRGSGDTAPGLHYRWYRRGRSRADTLTCGAGDDEHSCR